MFAKKVTHKIQYLVRVESIEQIPSAFVSNGGIKLTYAKGKQTAHKGETSVVPCASQNLILGETLKWKTKLHKDEKTGGFDTKVVVFKLKHVATDGHKEKTLGTADIDLALLSTAPKSETKLAVQFAAKNQGKLKTKATLNILSLWLKVGDKRFNHATETEAVPPTGDVEHEDDMFFSANTMITTPFFDDDATISEMSTTSSNVVDDLDDSTVLIESADLENDSISKNGARTASNSSLTHLSNPNMASSTSSATLSGTSASQLASIPEEGLKKSPSQMRVVSSASAAEDPIRPTKTMRMKKQTSHPEIKPAVLASKEPTRAGSGTLGMESTSRGSVHSNYIYSASTSALPEFHVEPAASRHSTQLMAGAPPTRSRGKSTAGSSLGLPTISAPRPLSAHIPYSVSLASSASVTPPIPSTLQNAPGNTANLGSASHSSIASSASASSANSLTHANGANSGMASGAGNGHHQAQIRQPIEASPYVSYVDLDAPELPESAQSSVVYLAPNSFAIQNAAVSGDEVARLRAEKLDNNLKMGLLSKQVMSLEQRLLESVRKLEEAEKRETAKNTEVHNLEKKLRRLRKKSKLLDSTLDESSTTSSGGPTDASRTTTGERKRKRKRVKDSSSHSASNSTESLGLNTSDAGDTSSSSRIPQSRLCWTPEEERLGLLIIIALSMLLLLFLCSTQFRLSIATALEQLGILSTPITSAAAETLLPDPVITAANELSEAFASTLNLSHVPPAIANNT